MITITQFRIQLPYLEMILSKRKTVEGRVFKPALKSLKVNDLIRFTADSTLSQSSRFADVKVLYLHSYPTFRKMLLQEGIGKCLPGISDLEQAVKIYYSFPLYQELEKKYGVLAIGIGCVELKEDN